MAVDTITQANAGFYRAFEALDLRAMDEVWAHGRSAQARVTGGQAVEAARAPQPPLVDEIPEHDREDPQAVDARGDERRRGGLGKVARGHRDLRDAKAGRHDLRDDLLVEDETVGVRAEVDGLQHLTTERAVAGVVFGQAQPERTILDPREEPVGDEFPPRHALRERRAALEPRAEDDVRLAARDRLDDLWDERGVVLIVGVDHDDDVGAGAQRLRVARLPIGAVAVVAVVHEDLEPELPRDFERRVGRAVVHEDHEVDRVLRQLLVGHAQRPAGVVRRHHDDDLWRAVSGLDGHCIWGPEIGLGRGWPDLDGSGSEIGLGRGWPDLDGSGSDTPDLPFRISGGSD